MATNTVLEGTNMAKQAELNQSLTDLIKKRDKLATETVIAVALCEEYQALSGLAGRAITAAEDMGTAWTFLVSDLDAMLSDLKAGRAEPDEVRKVFLAAAKSEAKEVVADTKVIKAQMEGAGVDVAKPIDPDVAFGTGQLRNPVAAYKWYKTSGIATLIDSKEPAGPAVPTGSPLSTPAKASASE